MVKEKKRDGSGWRIKSTMIMSFVCSNERRMDSLSHPSYQIILMTGWKEVEVLCMME